MAWLQTTQSTPGEAVTVVWKTLCKGRRLFWPYHSDPLYSIYYTQRVYYSEITVSKHKSIYTGGYFIIYVPSIHIIFTIISHNFFYVELP